MIKKISKIKRIRIEREKRGVVNHHVNYKRQPPFDKPQSFVKLFDGTNQRRLVEMVTMIKENAVKIMGY
jgi:hypothetical protein